MKNTDLIRKFLSYDTISKLEKKYNKSLENFTSLEKAKTLALIMMIDIQKSNLLNASGDSNYYEPTINYKIIIADLGFKKVFCDSFFYEISNQNETNEIWVNPELGAILHFDTYKQTINSAILYYNWNPIDIDTYSNYVESGFFNNHTWIGIHDVREAVRFKIEELINNGHFIKPWIEQASMLFTSYKQRQDKNFDCKKYTEDIISSIPELKIICQK